MIELTLEPISPQSAVCVATDPGCGVRLNFFGTVRHQCMGRDVAALMFDAYDEMAVRELERIEEEAFQRVPSLRSLDIIHRLGRVSPGEVSMMVSVEAPHRDDAFSALRFVVDEIKRRVPIWKKEVSPDGGETWLHPMEGLAAESGFRS